MRPEDLRPEAKNSAQMISATIPANIFPMLWNIAIASLKIFFTSRRRTISTSTTKTHTMKSAAIVSSFTLETTRFEKTMRSAIGSTGKKAYQAGASGAVEALTSTVSACASSPFASNRRCTT